MLFKWEIEALWGAQVGQIGPSHHVEYFLLFFLNFLHSDTDKKVDLGNKERPNVYEVKIYACTFSNTSGAFKNIQGYITCSIYVDKIICNNNFHKKIN